MKRLLRMAGIVGFCLVLAGCGSDSREGLISDTVGMMNQAANELDNIQKAVAAAAKDSKENGAKLNLTAAIKATDKLKETGDKTLEIKARTELVKATITDAEKQSNAENKRDEINAAFKNLQTKQDALRKTLAEAEKLNVSNAKQAVEDLRKKIVVAESPFEALTR